MFKQFLILLGRLWSYLYPLRLRQNIKAAYTYLYTGYYARQLKHCGTWTRLKPHFVDFRGGQYISIGDNCTFMPSCSLTAWDTYQKQHFTPEISIGDNCSIGVGSHITAINSILLGNNVLIGPYVLISDNAHGESQKYQSSIAPNQRPLCSKGKVVIEDNVWIGQGAMIMPGVHIGAYSIIAANSVVTHDIPAYSVTAGTPAKVIKRIE